jgi:hypothetical protein
MAFKKCLVCRHICHVSSSDLKIVQILRDCLSNGSPYEIISASNNTSKCLDDLLNIDYAHLFFTLLPITITFGKSV